MARAHPPTRGHLAWDICPTCEGLGEENTAGRMVLVTWLNVLEVSTGIRHDRTFLQWQPYEPVPTHVYKGPCRICSGSGRTRPEGWQEPVFDVDGRILDPGSDPELREIVKRRRQFTPTQEIRA